MLAADVAPCFGWFAPFYGPAPLNTGIRGYRTRSTWRGDVAEALDATLAVVLPAGLDTAEASDIAEAYAAIGGRFPDRNTAGRRGTARRRAGGRLPAGGRGSARARRDRA